jgi:pyruvyl transferase EpsO
MAQLAQRHDVLLPLIGGRPVQYLDLPMHGNVGDLLIMQGTLRFFERHRVNVNMYGMYFNYLPVWASDDDVLLLHGGGNFGDIYGPFQQFREKIIASRPKNRIVILPQSIHFDNPEKFAKCCSVLRQHRDLHICVRDSVSAALADQMSPYVYMLPDMAHQLWPLKRTCPSSLPVLQLQRRDSETISAVNNCSDTFDWNDLIGNGWTFFLSQIAERSMYHATRLGINKSFANFESLLWIRQANIFITRAAALFSKYDRVESDRLHAHILACLLSIPNEITDNIYKKNSRYINQWTKGSSLVNTIS